MQLSLQEAAVYVTFWNGTNTKQFIKGNKPNITTPS